MPQENQITSQLYVKIDGADLSPEYMNVLMEGIVDENTSVPDMFTLRFRDDKAEMIDDSLFEPAKAVEISATTEAGTEVVIFKGEITAVEPEFREGKAVDMVIRGFDKTYRMYREVKTRTFLKMTDSDIATKIAQEGGLSPQVDSTQTVYDYVSQNNQTNLAFLTQRAWRIGFECFEDDQKLYFRKPPTGGGAVTLTWGEDLRTFRPVLSVAEQVDEVLVRGWDIRKKEAIVGKAKKGELYASTAITGTGQSKASSLGTGKKTIVNLPVTSQAEADKLAQARINELSGMCVTATGSAFRRPDLRAGQVVKLEQLGSRFSGSYLVTAVRHVFDSTGFTSEFEVSGLRSGLLSDLLMPQESVQRWPGAVSGIVTNTDDPEKLGRVKVAFPWMDDNVESHWARVISPGAGKERGLFMLPDVGDEVVLIFDHGDFDHAYVVGGLWNGKDKIPPTAGDHKPLVRSWRSHEGHQITIDDTPQKKNIQIITASEDFKLILDDKNKKIELTTKGGHKLILDDMGKNVDLESSGTMNIKSALPMSIKSDANISIEGKLVEIKSTGPVSVSGKPVNIN
ncbi:MAG: VgrG-related protein [Chloroflexota bacterium]|jgi:phage protein D/phage baseplate assembly protein gpV